MVSLHLRGTTYLLAPLQTEGVVAKIERMQVHQDQVQRITPLPGKCIIEWDTLPEKIGSLFIPESARARENRVMEPLHTGTVLKMTPAVSPSGVPMDDFKAGDKVLVACTLEDLQDKISITQNNRVRAVIGDTANAASGD